MSKVAAIGAPAQVAGFALAGALVLPADDDEQIVAAWRALPDGVGIVVLTPVAAAALAAAGTPPTGSTTPLTVVMPP